MSFAPLVSPCMAPTSATPLSPTEPLVLGPSTSGEITGAVDPQHAAVATTAIHGADTVYGDDYHWFNPQSLHNKSRYNFLAQLASINPLAEIPRAIHQTRKTGIICTIGPKTNSPEAIAALRRAGMNVLRLNFSHGTYDYHASVIASLKASYAIWPGPEVAVAVDNKGPEIRTGNFADNAEVLLAEGSRVTVTTDRDWYEKGNASCFWVDYKNLPKILEVGSFIYIDDGLIKLQVESIDPEGVFVVTKVVNPGKISSHKGVNLPGAAVDLPSLSEKDVRDLKWAVENGADFIFASFVRNGKAIEEIREVLGPKGARIQIIAKIENQQGIDNFDEILIATDGVMVARGDMGIEIPVEKVFLAQKMMIAKCNILGKPVICATQMLESMTYSPRPTRAEVSDVANAVMDGTDCVMLSGETAKGNFPSETVAMMHTICKEAESAISNNAHYRAITDIHPEMFQTSETLASAAVNAAFSRALKAIIVFSMTGRTARLISKYRPNCPIICVTTDPVTARQSVMSRGVYPVLVEETYDADKTTWLQYIERQLQLAVEACVNGAIPMLAKGDVCVVVQGWAGGHGHSNTMRLVVV